MANKTIIQTIKKYGNSLIIPITKAAKEIGLQAGDPVIATIDNGLKDDCPVSFDEYVNKIIEESKDFRRSSGSLFLTIEDCYWQTPDIIRGFVEKEIKKTKTAQPIIKMSDI